jgi:hemoglobin-like flavoprotein
MERPEMTPAQKKLVRTTWAQVGPVADTAAALFYARLFLIDPSTRPLFRTTNMVQQRKKLLHVIGVAVSGLDRLDALVPVVEDLGRRHATYGVKDEHYESVGAALLWTLEQGLGDAWNAETKAAWSEVYGLLSGIMRRAQREAMAPAA